MHDEHFAEDTDKAIHMIERHRVKHFELTYYAWTLLTRAVKHLEKDLNRYFRRK